VLADVRRGGRLKQLKYELRSWWLDAKFNWARFRNPVIAVPVPMLEGELHEELSAAMRTAGSYLEYGSGGSTLLAAKLVRGRVVSVESDRAFRNAITAAIAPEDRERVTVLHVDVGPTTRFGRPLLPLHHRWEEYPVAPWRVMRAPPDLIFVDGRFRVACVLTCLLRLPPTWDGRIYIDDYGGGPWQRDYAVIDPFIAKATPVGRALRFAPGAASREAIEAALIAALKDAR
jgi:hypothetical protein